MIDESRTGRFNLIQCLKVFGGSNACHPLNLLVSIKVFGGSKGSFFKKTPWRFSVILNGEMADI